MKTTTSLDLFTAEGKPVRVGWTSRGLLLTVTRETLIPGTLRAREGRGMKLSATQVRAIRKARKRSRARSWDFSKSLAKKYSVSPATISHIVTKKTWKNLED